MADKSSHPASLDKSNAEIYTNSIIFIDLHLLALGPRLSSGLGDGPALPAIFENEAVKLVPAFRDLAVEGRKLHHLFLAV